MRAGRQHDLHRSGVIGAPSVGADTVAALHRVANQTGISSTTNDRTKQPRTTGA